MATDTFDAKAFAEQYGFAWQTVKQSDDLTNLFADATNKELAAPAFLAALKQTDWWSKSSGPWKAAFKLEFTGDKTWIKKTLPDAEQAVLTAATNLGVSLNNTQKTALARLSVYNGWSTADLTNALVRGSGDNGITTEDMAGVKGSGGVKNFKGLDGKVDKPRGQYLLTFNALKDIAEKNGVGQSKEWYNAETLKILDPNDTFTEQDSYDYLTRQAKHFFPALADQVGIQGQNYVTVRDAAQPYITHIAQGLGIADPSTITLKDDLFKKALLGGKDAKGNPAPMSLYDLDVAIRQDKRWASSSEGQAVNNRFADYVSSEFGI